MTSLFETFIAFFHSLSESPASGKYAAVIAIFNHFGLGGNIGYLEDIWYGMESDILRTI